MCGVARSNEAGRQNGAVERRAGSAIPNSVKKRVLRSWISAALSSRHDAFAGDQRIGEINAEAARKVVVANSGHTNRVC